MPVATAMILLVQVIAFFIIAHVMVHAHGGRMALVKPVKNMLAVRITVSEACMAKQLLQLRGRYCCGTHDLLFINASKGDTIAARLDCCKCR